MKRIICLVLCLVLFPVIAAGAKERTESELNRINIIVIVLEGNGDVFDDVYYDEKRDTIIIEMTQSFSYQDYQDYFVGVDGIESIEEEMYEELNGNFREMAEMMDVDITFTCRCLSSDGKFIFSMVDGKYSTIDPKAEVDTEEKASRLRGIAVLLEMSFLSVEDDFIAEAEYRTEENTIYLSLIAREITKGMWDEVIEQAPETEEQIKEMLKERIESTTQTINSEWGYYDVNIVMMVETSDGEIACRVTSEEK